MLATALTLALMPLQSTAAPAVSTNSLLEGLSFFLEAPEPGVIVGPVSFAFAPAATFTPKLVISQNGKPIQEIGFQREMIRGGAFAAVRPRVPGQVMLGSENGDRTFEYFVDDKLAGRFTVNLTKTTQGDPLDPKVRWKIVGPWKDLAAIKHKPDDGYRQDLMLTYWVAQHELQPGEKTVVAHLKKGSTIIASTRESIPNGPRYLRSEVPLLRPDKSSVQVKDLSKMSGSYTLEVTAGKRMLRSWKLSIANGAIVPHPRSDHTKTAPELWLAPREQSGTSVSPFGIYWLAR